MERVSDQYSYTLTWDEDEQYCIARCREHPFLGCDGPTPEAALCEIRHLVQFVVEDMGRDGDPVPQPGEVGEVEVVG